MSASRALRGLILALAALLLLGACAPEPHGALEPLRGADDEASVGGSEAAPDQEPLALEDLPADMFEGAPEGFGEVPLDEMDLPPDDLPPPIEGGAPPPPPPAAGPPTPTTPTTGSSSGSNPAPNTPIPPGGAGGVDAAVDYCGLFQQYGTVMGAVDAALASGSAQQIASSMQLAAQVHDRAAELDPTVGGQHRAIAHGMRGLQDLLAGYSYDIEGLFEAMDSDPAVAARFEATQVDAELDRTAEHVQSQCGISLI